MHNNADTVHFQAVNQFLSKHWTVTTINQKQKHS